VPELPERGGRVRLSADAIRHARVLRLGPGDAVRLFDGEGHEADGQIAVDDDGELACDVGPVRRVDDEGPRVVLVQVLPKGAKLEPIVRMTTEVGVSAIHLASSERAVARPAPDRAARRVARLGRVAREAARQCGRAVVPEVHAPAPLAEVASRAPSGATRLLLHPGGGPLGAPSGGEVWLVVGPEGGLSDPELEALERLGYRVVGVRSHVLRVETAAPVAVALALDRARGRD